MVVDEEIDVVAHGDERGRDDRRLFREFGGVDQTVTGGVDVAEVGERYLRRGDDPPVADLDDRAAVRRIVGRSRRRVSEDGQRGGTQRDEQSTSTPPWPVTHGPVGSLGTHAIPAAQPTPGGGPPGPPVPPGRATSALSGLDNAPTAAAPTRQAGRFGESYVRW